jgi:hypothetical protein
VAKDSIEVSGQDTQEVFDKPRDAQRVRIADFDWVEYTVLASSRLSFGSPSGDVPKIWCS